MKTQVLQKDLKKAVTLASHFVNTRVQLPILNNFLLVSEKTKLKVIATNLEMSICLSLGAKIEVEGKTTVPAKPFTEIINHLTPGHVDLEEDKEKLKISSVGFTGNLGSAVANDYPAVPSVIKEGNETLPSDIFLHALSKTIFAVSVDETRPVLTGVLFSKVGDTFSLVASDGFRLSKLTFPLKSKNKEDYQAIIPKSPLLEIYKELGESSLTFELNKNDNQAVFAFGDIIIASRIIDGDFPNFEKIIPAAPTTKVELSKDDLLNAVKLASVFTKEEGGITKFTVKEGSVEVSAASSTLGEEKTVIEAKVSGGELSIYFNFKFVEDFLNVVEGDSVQIELTDDTTAAIFKDPKDEHFLHLIMPAKVQS